MRAQVATNRKIGLPGTIIVGIDALNQEYDPRNSSFLTSTSIDSDLSKAVMSLSKGTGISCSAAGLSPDFSFFCFGSFWPHILKRSEEGRLEGPERRVVEFEGGRVEGGRFESEEGRVEEGCCLYHI